jgi:hypothetical protein
MSSQKARGAQTLSGPIQAHAPRPLHSLAVSYPLANALYQWEEGARELAAIDDPRRRRLADRVIDAIRVELRRRIGPTFSAEELADLYGEGTDWAQQIALDVAPAAEGDAQILADAAFWAYLRNAGNFAGGRSLA